MGAIFIPAELIKIEFHGVKKLDAVLNFYIFALSFTELYH